MNLFDFGKYSLKEKKKTKLEQNAVDEMKYTNS